MKSRLWQWSLGTVTGALVAAGLFALLRAVRAGGGAGISTIADSDLLLIVTVLGALASGAAALVTSFAGRRPIVQVIQAPAVAPPPVVTPTQPKRRQAPLLGRLHAARVSADLRWDKLSKSLQKLLTISAKRLRGQSILDRIHADDRTVIERRFLNPSKVAFEARFRLLPAPKARNAKAEALVHVQLAAAPLRDDLGKLQAWRCVFIDVTRQVQAEDVRQGHVAELAQLQEKGQRFQRQFDRLKESYFDLYHHAPVMYFSVDAEGKFVTFNDTLLRVLGHEREELLGRKYADILTMSDNPAVSFQSPSDKEQEWETKWRRRDGSWLDVWLRAVAVFDEQGRFVRWRASALDFTERNRLANQLRAHTEELERTNARLRHINTELEGFTHVVSHDLKEPLRTLQAYSHLLAEDFSSQLSTDGFQYVNHLLQASRRLGQLIDDLLNLSQAGRPARAPQAFNLIEVVATVRRDLVNMIQRKEAIILTEGTLPTVVGDPQRITQLLTNLVANGLKYNQHASPQVVIGPAAPGSDAHHAVIFVRDNGIGIDPAHHEQIFGLFRRLSTKEKYEGTGAGLAICKKIVEAHGGRIWLESQPGQGATFYFTLPQPGPRGAGQHGRLPPTENGKLRARAKPRSAGPGKHVLLVEDMPEVGAIIQRLGERSGLEITWFPTAEQAWDWLQDAQPDFLLLDINLPGMSGIELCRRVRDVLHSETPIALFSQEQQPEELARLREIGADHFLSKDLLSQPAVWQQKLQEVLERDGHHEMAVL